MTPGISLGTSVLLKRGGSSLESCRTTLSILFASIFTPFKRPLQAAFCAVRDVPGFISAFCMLFVVWAVGDAGQLQRHPCQLCEGFGGGRPVPEFRGVDGGVVLKSGHALNPYQPCPHAAGNWKCEHQSSLPCGAGWRFLIHPKVFCSSSSTRFSISLAFFR